MATDLPSGGKPAALGALTAGAALQHLRAWLSSLRPAGALRLILALAFLEGALCFVAIPPWWHYDEPGHFEYAWLAAHLPQWPAPHQYDQDMRRQMAKSMLRYDWYTIREAKPDLKSSQPIPIGVTQVGDQPGYYFLASLPLRLMPGADITLQYLAVRSVSLLLFLLIIVVVWCALGEILPPAHPLRWMTTAFVALLPAFADSMTSVNNDVAAALAGSLALWACLLPGQKHRLVHVWPRPHCAAAGLLPRPVLAHPVGRHRPCRPCRRRPCPHLEQPQGLVHTVYGQLFPPHQDGQGAGGRLRLPVREQPGAQSEPARRAAQAGAHAR